MKKRILSLILAGFMIFVMLPIDVRAEEPQLPSVIKFATPTDLVDANKFTLHTDNGSGVAQKVNFGYGKTWYIAGKDSNGSLVLMCDPANSLGSMAFGSNNDYKSSSIRTFLSGALSNFRDEEKALMNSPTVYTNAWDNLNNTYSTSDELYLAYGVASGDYMTVGTNSASSLNNGIKIGLTTSSSPIGSPYVAGGNGQFWIRTPSVSSPYVALSAIPNFGFDQIISKDNIRAVVPAFNLDMSRVLFASAATKASANANLETAMTFRISAEDKIQSKAEYISNQINVTKGTDSGDLFLYVQGKDSTGDWVWSEKVTSTGSYNIADIHDGLTSTTNCKIWLETTNGSDNLAYAKMMSLPTPGPNPEPQGNYLDALYKMFEEAIKIGSTDTIYWDKGDALPNGIMKLLLNYPVLSLDFKYIYEGVEHEVFIGPGQATDDDIEWYGPLWLLEQYGEKKDLPVIHGVYIIESGDTLNKLAKKFNTTVDDLLRLNPDIKDRNKIYSGHSLNY